jgi:hypothetical protein
MLPIGNTTAYGFESRMRCGKTYINLSSVKPPQAGSRRDFAERAARKLQNAGPVKTLD